MRVTSEVLRALLAAGEPAATLVLLEGRLPVVAEAELGSDRWAGAIVVVSRADALSRLRSAYPSEHELRELAAQLDTEEARRAA